MPTIVTVVTSIATTLVEMLPQIIETGVSILVSLIEGLTNALPKLIEMLPTIITTTVTTLVEESEQDNNSRCRTVEGNHSRSYKGTSSVNQIPSGDNHNNL